MTENEAIKGLETLRYQCKHNGECGTCNICCSAIPLAIQALEEIQQYREIGRVEEVKYLVDSYNDMMHTFGDNMCALEQYKAIGTVEECKHYKKNV